MPNLHLILSLLRILTAALTGGLAWLRMETWFIWGLAVVAATYLISRWLPTQDKTDKKLQQTADIATFMAIASGCWFLFPHLIIQERIVLLVALVAYVATLFPGYRNRDSGIFNRWRIVSTLLMIGSILVALLTNNTWMFRLAVAFHIAVVMLQFSTRKNEAP